jgi:AcrR family transcriptional regulator
MDRRIERSRQKLRSALIDLMLSEAYDTISIRDVTTRADVGYATFFRHYADKEALLLDVLGNLVDAMQQMLNQDESQFSAETEGRLIFVNVRENHQVFRVLLQGEGTQAFIAQIEAQGVADISKRYPIAADAPIPPDVAANHAIASIIALIRWWLENDMPLTPERMGQIYADLVIRPLEKLSAES